MGCGSSRGDVIKSVSSEEASKKEKNKSKGKSNANGNAVDTGGGGERSTEDGKESLNSNFSDASTIPASEKYQNGTENSKSSPMNPLGKLPPLKPPRSGKIGFIDQRTDSADAESRRHIPPVAFEVPVESPEGNGSLIKKHPPRRLRKMVEDQPEEPQQLTHEVLHEKVQLANQRRNQVLTQRVASARQKSARVHKPLFDSGGFIPDYGGEIETAEKDEPNGPDYL